MRLFANDGFLDFGVRERLPKEVDTIEMSTFDSAFLCGLIRKYRPGRILEVASRPAAPRR